MKLSLTRFIFACWGLFFAFWLALAIRDRSTSGWREALGSRLAYLGLLGAGAVLLVFDLPLLGPLLDRYLPPGAGFGVLGLLLVGAGMALAVWGRVLLGSAWSARVSTREGQPLVRRGPYALVRHPIYAGALLAVLGTVLAIGEIRGLVGLCLIGAGLALKIRVEETAMRELLGDEYRKYQEEVKALIPFLL